MFELESLRRESGLDPGQLEQLERDIRAEFPNDEMMFELHLLRVLDMLRRGWVSRESALLRTAERGAIPKDR